MIIDSLGEVAHDLYPPIVDRLGRVDALEDSEAGVDEEVFAKLDSLLEVFLLNLLDFCVLVAGDVFELWQSQVVLDDVVK